MTTAKTQTPKVSVCIPTYRGAATIGQAIESVLAPSLADFELIVIDDASPDNTLAIVERFTDHRLVYLRNERNLGPQGNWNRCLQVAQGEYFKLLPHDDLLHPRCLEGQVALLDDDCDESIALVFSARDVLGPNGRVLTRRGYPGGHEGTNNGSVVMRACVRRGTNLIGDPGSALFQKGLRALGDFKSVQITDSACFSVARHHSSLLPPRSRSYRGDNYSYVGGNSRIYTRACQIAGKPIAMDKSFSDQVWN